MDLTPLNQQGSGGDWSTGYMRDLANALRGGQQGGQAGGQMGGQGGLGSPVPSAAQPFNPVIINDTAGLPPVGQAPVQPPVQPPAPPSNPSAPSPNAPNTAAPPVMNKNDPNHWSHVDFLNGTMQGKALHTFGRVE